MPVLHIPYTRTFEKYKQEFDTDTFAVNIILLGQNLMHLVNDNKIQKWKSLVENMDMTRNSKKAWNTLKQLNRDPKAIRQHSNITANLIAYALLKNSEPEVKIKRKQTSRDKKNETSLMQAKFSKEELKHAIKKIKHPE